MVTPVPLRVAYDDPRGGRWTTLSGGGREWLWHRDDPDRDTVRPGDAFVDAGGLEECVPTVRGTPDHGAAWSRAWRPTGPGESTVDCPDFTLTRRLADHSGAVVADYRLRAEPGFRFVWAAHALLDLSPAARLAAPTGTPTRLYPDVHPGSLGPPPGRWPWLTGPWPDLTGPALDRFGPDDGSAVGAVLVGCASVQVTDGADTLRLALDCDDQPRSTALWRNLRGWPERAPYRSTGVEPMLGAVFDLATAGPEDAAAVPAGGEVTWRLTISAHRTSGGTTR